MSEKESKLTPKQQMFVDAYLGEARGNATQAAELAGYKATQRASLAQQGSRMYRNVEIQEAISERVSELAMTPEEVLSRLREQATGSVGDFSVITPDGELAIDFNKAQELQKLHLVKKVKVTKTTISENMTQTTVTMELYDAQAALVHLGKYHKLFVDRQELSGPNGEPLAYREIVIEKHKKDQPEPQDSDDEALED